MSSSSSIFGSLDLRNPVISLSKALISLPLLKDLCSALSRVDTVTHIDLSHNQLGDAGAEILAELLFDKPQIRVLNLKSNGISDLGVSFLCRALARHATVQTLILGSNPISDVGLVELGRLISDTYFTMTNAMAAAAASASSSSGNNGTSHQNTNNISSSGAVVMNTASSLNLIRSTTTAGNEQVSKNNNNGSSSLVVVNAPLSTSPIEIEELDLIDTPISLHGALNFADALVKNETLIRVRLPHVLGHRVLQEVERLMKRNWIRKNHIDEKRANQAVEHYEDQMQTSRLSQQWRSQQSKAKPPPRSSGFTIDEWADPQLVPSLVFLEILDRKSKLNKKEEEKENKKKTRKVKPTGYGASHSLKLPPITSSRRTIR